MSKNAQRHQTRFWIWVFGEIEGLRWVLKHRKMAFPGGVVPSMARMAEGDQAVLYVARGAFHNPTRDEARAVGTVTVAGTPKRRDVLIGHRRYGFVVEFIPKIILGERDGPPLKALVGSLKLVRQRAVWGMYFRRNPVEVEQADFRTIARAVETWKVRQSQGDRTKQDTRGDAVRSGQRGTI